MAARSEGPFRSFAKSYPLILVTLSSKHANACRNPTASLASFYGQPAFLTHFGVVNPTTGLKVIPATWQSGLGNGLSTGGIIGLMINGWASERFGPVRTYIISMIGMIISIFGPVFSRSLEALVASEIVCGLFWGVFRTLTTAYASEVCPIVLRHYLTAYIKMCWGIGIFLSSDVRLRLAPSLVIQWVWPIPLIIGAYFAPESPWWLVREGRHEEAKSVGRLTNADYFSKEDPKTSVANMIQTTAIEREMQEGTSYLQCFTRIDLRRTEIAMMVFAIQLPSGENPIGQGVHFIQAGLDTIVTYDANLALNSMFTSAPSPPGSVRPSPPLFTPLTRTTNDPAVLYRFGQRSIYIAGLVIMAIVFLIIGTLGFSNSSGAKWAVSGSWRAQRHGPLPPSIS
ncbi:hypothetical protein DFH09DRAFT_1328531 [Mycena vulgaris]|nr:hypothetical protein DFH09DRAFT_1328531 [Mycena vulgaris]